MSVHRIRLIGPWTFTWTPADPSTGVEIPSSGTVKMPCDWQSQFGSLAGSATFSRQFHSPTNLEAHEQIVVVLTEVGGAGRISLNGEVLTQFPDGSESPEVDVTRQLQPFNVLEVALQFTPTAETPATTGGLFGPVMIEIRT